MATCGKSRAAPKRFSGSTTELLIDSVGALAGAEDPNIRQHVSKTRGETHTPVTRINE